MSGTYNVLSYKASIPRVTGNINTRATDIRTNQLNNTITIHVEEGLRLLDQANFRDLVNQLSKLQKDERKKGMLKKYYYSRGNNSG